MKFGYARVSKNDQSLDVQVGKLERAGCDEIFREKISGANDDRPQLKALLGKLRKGDVVCVVRLDRFGRRMVKLIELMEAFRSQGIAFVALENNIDTTTPMGRILFSMCAAFSEMERELLRERVKAGLDFAREKGRIGGRPKALTPAKEIILRGLYRAGDLSVQQMCDVVGISRSVYYRAVRHYIEIPA